MENEYFMGVDPYGYTGDRGNICVMSRSEDNKLMLVATYEGRNDETFTAEFNRLLDLYKPVKVIRQNAK